MPNATPERITDPARLESLRQYCLLDTPADPAFDRLTRLACRVFNVPIALVSLVDDRRQFFKSQVGLEEPWGSRREMPLDYSYCQHVVATGEPLIVEDSANHPLVYDNRSTLELHIMAYAGMPLVTSTGEVLGSFCVIDKKPRLWTEEEIGVLGDLAQSVMTEIELQYELNRRHTAEAALHKHEQQLQAVITSAPVIVYVVDQDGMVVMSEGSGLAAIGVEPNRIVGRSIFDIYGRHPEIVSAVERALHGESLTILTEQETPIGVFHFEVGISPLFDADHEIKGAIGVATDVSARLSVELELEETVRHLTTMRRIEVELSESLNLSSVLTIAMDAALRASAAEHGFIGLLEGDQLRLVHTSGAYVQDTCFAFDHGVIGRALRTLKPQLILDVENDPDYVDDIPGMKAQMTIPLIHRDHLIGALNLQTRRPELFTRAGFDFLTLIAGHITVAIDNAQLYQVSQQQLEELQRLYLRVSELEQLKTDMIRIAAHDLRNPLGVVKGYTDMMLEDKDRLTLDHIEFVQLIQAQAQKMFKLIDDILSLQRIEAIQQNKHAAEVDVTELVRDVYVSNEKRAQQKGQTYHLLLPEFPLTFYADVAQLREAMDNLISNAIKYTPDGGSVMVRLDEDVDGEHIVFEVEDTGLGVPEAQQARLFQPFFRASNAKMSQIEGTGLGLHLVKNIVERSGGQMRFRSVVGEGSVFGFTLPVMLRG